MRTLTALFALFAATACATAPCAHCERSRTAVVYTFVDTDDDGLPDTRVQQGLIDLGPEVVVYAPAKRHPVRTQPATRQPDVRAGDGFGCTSFGQSVFVDTELADGERSVNREQVTNGTAVRMAVLYPCAGGQPESVMPVE